MNAFQLWCTRGFMLFAARFTLIVHLTILLWGCPSRLNYLPSPEQINNDGPYIHAASGMIFPTSVKEYQRYKINRYDADNLDMSAGYQLTRPSLIVATVYIYPTPPVVSIGSPAHVVATAKRMSAQGEFNRGKNEIFKSHPSARMLSETETLLSKNGLAHTGWRATFESDGGTFGLPYKVTSHLYVFSYVADKWTVKYRFTHPKDFDAAGDIETFLQTLEWTIK